MNGLIDVHTHIGVDLGDDRRQSAGELLASMDAAGVAHAVVSTFEGGPDVEAGNLEVLRASSAEVGRLLPFVVFVPTETPAVRARFVPRLRDWMARDAPPVGIVLNPTMHPCDLSHPEIDRLVDVCAELGLVVMLHYMAQWSDAADGGARLARRHPDVTFLVPSIGWIPAGIELFGDLGNVLFDTSKSYGRMTVQPLLATVGVERVLFGSGSPETEVENELGKLHASDLTDADLSSISYGNARRVFGMSAPWSG